MSSSNRNHISLMPLTLIYWVCFGGFIASIMEYFMLEGWLSSPTTRSTQGSLQHFDILYVHSLCTSGKCLPSAHPTCHAQRNIKQKQADIWWSNNSLIWKQKLNATVFILISQMCLKLADWECSFALFPIFFLLKVSVVRFCQLWDTRDGGALILLLLAVFMFPNVHDRMMQMASRSWVALHPHPCNLWPKFLFEIWKLP